MKLIVGILLSVVVVIQGAAIQNDELNAPIARGILAPASLFTEAHSYQKLLTDLQQDINEVLTGIRTSVSTVLKDSSSETLEEIEDNSDKILALDDPARLAIYDINSTDCVTNLKVILNGITEFTGFHSSNCIAAYDKSVEETLEKAYSILQNYEGHQGDVQQIVVRSFIGQNVYLHSEEIQSIFKAQYEKRSQEWDDSRPDVENFVKTLRSDIAALNSVLNGCFGKIQTSVAPAYFGLQAEIATCYTFDNTADPFAAFR